MALLLFIVMLGGPALFLLSGLVLASALLWFIASFRSPWYYWYTGEHWVALITWITLAASTLLMSLPLVVIPWISGESLPSVLFSLLLGLALQSALPWVTLLLVLYYAYPNWAPPIPEHGCGIPDWVPDWISNRLCDWTIRNIEIIIADMAENFIADAAVTVVIGASLGLFGGRLLAHRLSSNKGKY